MFLGVSSKGWGGEGRGEGGGGVVDIFSHFLKNCLKMSQRTTGVFA